MKSDLFGRLWFRLFFASVVPLAVALISVGLLANYVTVNQFDAFFQNDVQQRDVRLVGILRGDYRVRGGWAGASDQAQRLAQLSGERLVVSDESGKVVADSANQLVGRQAARNWRRAMPIVVDGQEVGTLYINPTLPGRASSVQERTFLDGVNRSLLFGLILAAVVSVFLSAVVARALGRQMASLIRVARQIGRGNLSLRAKVAGGELGELGLAINGMAADLQRSLRLRQQMVADVAHELRTPLQNISGYLEALKDGVAAADERTLGILTAETSVLRQMVDDLQELSLAESGALSVELTSVQVEQQVDAVLTSMQPRAEELGVALSNELPPDLPAVLADERRLRQVIANLVSNALKYTPPGGRVWLSARKQEDCLEITVADNGVGIDPADQPFIFERFFRVDPARARATGGAGLGLTIARELVQAMFGKIGVRSQKDQGSQFWVKLPLAPAPVSAVA